MWLTLQIVLTVLLIGTGGVIAVFGESFGLPGPAQGALGSGLITGGFALIGALLGRLQTRAETKADDDKKRDATRKLVTAELVNASVGYIEVAIELQNILQAGPSTARQLVRLGSFPRPMLVTSAFGAAVMALTADELDVLGNLTFNMKLTKLEVVDAPNWTNAPYLFARRLAGCVCADLEELAIAFDRIAPTRKLRYDGHERLCHEFMRQLHGTLSERLKEGA